MSSETGTRPSQTGDTNEEKCSENRGGATRGVAGTIQRAHDCLPDEAGPDLIRAVAMRAFREDAHPQEIWATIESAKTEGAK